MSGYRPLVDFTVEKREGVQLVVEAKNTTFPSRNEIIQYRGDLLGQFQVPQAEYFLLALTDHLYLWRGGAPAQADPEFVGDTAAALQPWLTRLKRPLGELGQVTFQMLVQAWLGELVLGTEPDSVNRRWLVESGLAESVRDGSLRADVAA